MVGLFILILWFSSVITTCVIWQLMQPSPIGQVFKTVLILRSLSTIALFLTSLVNASISNIPSIGYIGVWINIFVLLLMIVILIFGEEALSRRLRLQILVPIPGVLMAANTGSLLVLFFFIMLLLLIEG